MALSSFGAVYSWGSGSFGKLGHGSLSSRLDPCRVQALKDVSCSQVRVA